MDIRKRKIGFNYLTLEPNGNGSDVQLEIKHILNFILAQQKVTRKKNLGENKFCLLDYYELDHNETIQKIIFKSAVHSYRAPLLDRETVDERDNPKTLREGELQKTHFVIKYINGDAILLAEKYRGGLSVQQLVLYLNEFKQYYEQVNRQELNYNFSFEVIATDNLDEELDKMNRVLNACIYVDKQLLGSDALNFSNRINSVQESIIIDIRAQRTESIKETAKDIIAKFNGGERIVSKVRIKGKNFANNDVTIDTDFIEKKEWVNAHLDEDTGEVNSPDVFSQITEIANTII